jgi:sugar phosphate isomerase/epimerase
MLEAISKHYYGWEIVAEYKHSLPTIKKAFLELTPSYNMKFQVHAPLSDINIASPNEGIRCAAVKEVTDCIRTSREIGVDLVTIHPGHLSPITLAHKDIAMDLSRESLTKICRAADDAGISLALENMPKMAMIACITYEDVLSLIEGTEMRICFDFGHANTSGCINEFLEHADMFANIHIHDNCGKWDEHLVPGKGTIGFEKYMYRLKEYKGMYVYECRNLDEAFKAKESILALIA